MPRLHFGCFNCPQEGWLNTDVTPHLFLARVPGLPWLLHKIGKLSSHRLTEHRNGIYKKIHYLNVAKSWRYADGQFDAIYSSHVLEHLPLHAARVCLAESYRCLQSGGVLRISVPDLDALVADYDPSRAMAWATGCFEANERSEKNMHHFMYNFSSLSELLQAAGFSRIERQTHKAGLCPDVEMLDNRPESLFVEAIK